MLNNIDFSRLKPIVVLPDFFIDRIIQLKSKEHFFESILQKTKYGGGSIRDFNAIERRGGNAVNVAYALATLGVKVVLFTIADKVGSAFLSDIFSKFGDIVQLRIFNGRHGLTTALEFHTDKGASENIMLNHLRDIANIGSEIINSKSDLSILKESSAVVFLNWGSNNNGSNLLEYVFKNSSNSSFHFLDPADIDNRKSEFKEMLVQNKHNIDTLSINENECNSLCKAFDLNKNILNENSEIKLKKIIEELSTILGIEICLHTRTGSIWSDGNNSFFVSAFETNVVNLTGAGDCWDSGYIFSTLAGLKIEERLLFANAFASLYVGNRDAEPPNMEKVVKFLENNRCKTK
ncbi:MAG: PfkB family carbohydrate kinase [Nitrososphaeraceae archaeon]